MKWFFISLSLALGLALTVLASVTAYRNHQSQQWPTVVGQVIESGVARTRWSKQWYQPVVRYRYQVNNTDYEHQRIVFTTFPLISRFDSANAVSKRYAPGSFVNVRYHAERPHHAVLLFNEQWWRGLAVGVLLLGVGLMGGLAGVLRRQ